MRTRKRKKINNKVDLVLLLLFLVIGFYFSIEAIMGNLIPLKYIFIFMAAVLILFVGIFLTFKVRNSAFRIIRKVFLTVLCCVLLFGGIFQGQIRNAFSNVNDGSYYKDYMYVITLKDNDYESIEDVGVLGYLSQRDDLLDYSLKQLNEYSLRNKTYDTLEDELADLDDEEIDAVLISAKDQTLQELNDSSFSGKYKTIHTIEMTVESNNDVVQSDLTSKPFVVYVAGLDNMGEPTQLGLHDVNMLLMVDPVNHHVEMISINRDTYIPNPMMNDYPDKLTHLGWYGPETAMETLERIFGIEIDYYAKVTFESLIKIIDTLGGIDVDVQISFTEQDENRSFAEGDLIHLEKGYQHLNGSQALAYARHRHTEGWDVRGREQAQRDIIAAIVDKMLSVEGALKLGDVVNVAASYVSTNMSMDSARSFVKSAIDSGHGWTFGSSTVNGDVEVLLPCAMENDLERSVVLLEESDIQLVHDIYTSMNTQIHFNEFAFDLDDMEKYMDTFTLDKHVITLENYYEVVPEYFPEYLRYRF
ncbi:LCP family protein [uncultured Traorella sp.]|uniref:LCP family protein n=1 Tax=uncultured Traorella sp. TaxID=1929048 RepID=UPI0025F1C922|nr:LCP family protein [uncultured Traorella sp.]